MTRYTDCEARGVVTTGCGCAFCTDAGPVRDGVRVTVPIAFSDAQPGADHWPAAIFDAAGVPIREDALSPHERAMRGEQRTPEERERDRRHQAEAEQQARTANRAARGSDGAWDKALAKLHSGGGGVREAGFTRI